MKELQIGQRKIGPEHSPFIIAEAGINHEGELSQALKLVDAASEAGADCVKFQCHIPEKEMIPSDMTPGYISKESQWDIVTRCQLTEAEEKRIKKHCQDKGIIYLCTPFSREAADRLNRLGVSAFKIGSGECNNLPLLEHIAKMGKPMLLATGMNDLASIKKSLSAIRKYNRSVMLMHCTSVYPTPYENVRLGAIKELQETYDLPVGLSDHSENIYTCLGAVALGACVLEKHFTVSRKWPGPDVPISIEPDELAELVKGAWAIWQARGGKKTVLPEEKPIIDFAYACVVAIRDIGSDETLSLDNIWVKRPGTGQIKAEFFNTLIGKKARVKIKNNDQIKWTDVRD